ncbi:MAG: hypothetical protein GY798_28480 [Hyphomicrobiales bacterium]|nr:hypothetical protein [Hyphomicrobiales bacterium]
MPGLRRSGDRRSTAQGRCHAPPDTSRSDCGPEAEEGGPLAIIQTGDTVAIDLDRREINLDIPPDAFGKRMRSLPDIEPKTPRRVAGSIPAAGSSAIGRRRAGLNAPGGDARYCAPSGRNSVHTFPDTLTRARCRGPWQGA